MAFENGIGGTALNLAPDVPIYEAQQKGADAALAVQQDAAKRATLGVLSNIDINDPDSINKGMTALLASGQTQQASELANMQYQRYQRQMLQKTLESQDNAGVKSALGLAPPQGALTQSPQASVLNYDSGQAQPQTDQSPEQTAPDPKQIEMALHQHLIGDFQQAAQITDPKAMEAFKQQMHQKYDSVIPGGAAAVDAQISSEKSPSDWLAKAAEHAKALEGLRQPQNAPQSAPAASGQASAPQDASAPTTAPQAAPAAPTGVTEPAPVNPNPGASPGSADALVGTGQQAIDTSNKLASQSPQLDPNEKLWNGVTRGQAQVLASPKAATFVAALKAVTGLDLGDSLRAGTEALSPDKSAATTRATGSATNQTALAKDIADKLMPKVDTLHRQDGGQDYTTSDADKIQKLTEDAANGGGKYGYDYIKEQLTKLGVETDKVTVHLPDNTTQEVIVPKSLVLKDAGGPSLDGSKKIPTPQLNNPGNVHALPGNQRWEGQVGVTSDGRAEFDTPQHGIDALTKNIASRQTLHGINTVAGLIGDPKYGWSSANAPGNSPASTANYIKTVSTALGVDPNAKVDFTDPKVQSTVARAIMGFEGGNGRQSAGTNGVNPGTGGSLPPGAKLGGANSGQAEAAAADRTDFIADRSKYQDHSQEGYQNQVANEVKTQNEIRGYAQQYAAGKLTPNLQKINGWLGSLGFPPATDAAAGLAQLTQKLSGNATQSIKGLGIKSQQEFEKAQEAASAITDPKQSIVLNSTNALAAAQLKQDYAQKYEQWIQQHPETLSRQAFSQYYANTPGGKAGIYAMPAWQGIQVNGQNYVRSGTYHGKPAYIVGTGLGPQNTQVIYK